MNTWSLSWHGLTTVVGLEIRQRLRSRRWLWALIAWFVFIGAITGLVIWSVYQTYVYTDCGVTGSCSVVDSSAGPNALGVVTFFVLGMGLIVAPAFTATSINGDRTQGTLATLQATRLSSLEIAGGKLIAAWGSAAVFLVVALPFIVLSMVLGNISVWQVLVCFAIICVLVAIVCAVGLGWSSIFTRSAASTVMTYMSVVGLAVMSPMLVALSMPFVQEDIEVRVWGLSDAQWDEYNTKVNEYWEKESDNPNKTDVPMPPLDQCHWMTETYSEFRTDRVWWILVFNPFVIVADAAPLSPAENNHGSDILSTIKYGVREMSLGPALERDDCTGLYSWNPAYLVEYQEDGTVVVRTVNGTPVDIPPSPVEPRLPSTKIPVWPWGLAAHLLVGAVFFYVAVRRLQIPYRILTKGTRVA